MMTREVKHRIASFLFATAMISGSLYPASRATERPRITGDWLRRLHESDGLLRQGQWSEGKRIADSALSEMREQVAGGEGAANLLSMALLFKAIGEAGAGYRESAAWDFDMAQVLNGALVDVDLAPYKEAGEYLASW